MVSLIMNLIKNKKNILSLIVFSITFILSYLYLFLLLPLNSDTTGAYTAGSDANLSYKWSIANGRWTKGMLEIIIEKLGYYNIVPFFLFILLFVVCLYFIYNLNLLFEFKNIFLNCFISSVFFITPAFISIFMFINDLHAHILAILLGAIIIKKCFVDDNWNYYIPLLTLMIGIYQSYVCLICTVYVIYNIYLVLNDRFFEKNVKATLMKVLKFILYSIISIVIYFLINKVVLSISSIDSVLKSRFSYDFSINSLVNSFFKMYGMVVVLPFKNYAGINTTLLAKAAFLFSYIIILITIIWFAKNSNIQKFIALMLLLLVLPISMNLIVLASNHTIIQMTFGLGLIYLLIAVFLDYFICNEKKSWKIKYKNKIVLTLLIVFVIHMVYFANGYNYFSKIVSDSTRAFVIELVSKIKNTSNYNSNYKIYFSGNIAEDNLKDYYSYYDNEVFPLAMPYNSMLFPWEYKETINRYGAFKYVEADAEDVNSVISTDDFKNMPYYPNDGSVSIINNILVVKFSD